MKSRERVERKRSFETFLFIEFFFFSNSNTPRATFKRNLYDWIYRLFGGEKTFRIGGESRVKREHVAYRLILNARPRGWTRWSPSCFTGKFMSRKKASLPSVGDFLSAKWDEARLKSSLSIKTRGRGKKNERIDDNDNDNVINFLLVSSVDRNLCKPVNAR